MRSSGHLRELQRGRRSSTGPSGVESSVGGGHLSLLKRRWSPSACLADPGTCQQAVMRSFCRAWNCQLKGRLPAARIGICTGLAIEASMHACCHVQPLGMHVVSCGQPRACGEERMPCP
mmetsp:Transcript_62365/g.193501  ORF Transcript_62365/g.193501 Transcript_62365/m.193501 type:complete len:119 (+) Transcript_62365:1925-2281(+)